MRGRVGEDAHEALLTVTVSGPTGNRAELEVVDTGFTGALCLGAGQVTAGKL